MTPSALTSRTTPAMRLRAENRVPVVTMGGPPRSRSTSDAGNPAAGAGNTRVERRGTCAGDLHRRPHHRGLRAGPGPVPGALRAALRRDPGLPPPTDRARDRRGPGHRNLRPRLPATREL